jgi:hypothetical protein
MQGPTRIFAAALLAGLAAPAALAAKVPLREESHIVGSLVAARVADAIRKSCPTISARSFVVLAKMRDLVSYARSKGYSSAEVEAFLEDPAEKARLKQLAADHLKKAGAKPGNAQSYCAAGRAEIGAGTLAGALIRSRE